MLILASCVAIISMSFALLSFFRESQIFSRDQKPSATPAQAGSPTVHSTPTSPVVIVETPQPAKESSTSSQGSTTKTSRRMIVSDTILLDPGQFRSYHFVVESGYRNPRLKGNVNASGGGRNDVYLAILDEPNLRDFSEGRRFSSYYRDKVFGYKNIVIDLPPGSYYVILSNIHARFYPKRVKAELALEYD